MTDEKNDDKVPSCANCFFSEQVEIAPVTLAGKAEESPLVCRRYPPFIVQALTAMGQNAIGSASPPVRPDNWCGEHEPTHAPLIEH